MNRCGDCFWFVKYFGFMSGAGGECHRTGVTQKGFWSDSGWPETEVLDMGCESFKKQSGTTFLDEYLEAHPKEGPK